MTTALSECHRVDLPAVGRDQLASSVSRHLADNCPYAFTFRQIRIDATDGVVRLRGRVPSFYLKQILQTYVNKVEGVRQVENLVEVVSCNGLSSERVPHPKTCHEA